MLLFFIFIFILGLAVGSFLNVVIFRLENGEKIMNDRSKCLRCKHVLAWYDLFPVLSFLFLRGRCRYCGKKISWQYPLVEIATGILFVLIFNFSAQGGPALGWQFLLSISYLLFIISSLIVIFAYDLKHYIIPDKVIYPAIVVILGFNLLNDFVTRYTLHVTDNNFQSILNSQFSNFLFSAILAGGFFYSIVIITKGKGMGGGDIKLGFLMGLILGWPLVLIALFLSFIIGSVVGIFLMLVGKKKMKSMIPFGPFLVLGTFIALFFGEGIVEWYLNILN